MNRLYHFHEKLLTIPSKSIVELITSAQDKAIVLDIGHQGYRIDFLYTLIREQEYYKQLLQSTQSPIANVIIYSALDRINNHLNYLFTQLDHAVYELQHSHLPMCVQLAKIYESTGMQLTTQGIMDLASQKLIISDLYYELTNRINGLLFKNPKECTSLFDVSWDSKIHDILENRQLLLGQSLESRVNNFVDVQPLSVESGSAYVILDSFQTTNSYVDDRMMPHPSSQSTDSLQPPSTLPLDSIINQYSVKRSFTDSDSQSKKRQKHESCNDSIQIEIDSITKSLSSPSKQSQSQKHQRSNSIDSDHFSSSLPIFSSANK